MKRMLCVLALTGVTASGTSFATGLATCDSGPQKNWQPSNELEKRLIEEGWQVRRIKIDGGCYEVYAIDENGDRIEAYFDPNTLERVPIEE